MGTFSGAVDPCRYGCVVPGAALWIDFMDPDCYTDGDNTCTNLGSLTLTSTYLYYGPAIWHIVDGHFRNSGNYAQKPQLTGGDIFQDNATYEMWFQPPDTGVSSYGIFSPLNYSAPNFDQGVWAQMYDTDPSSPVALYIRGSGTAVNFILNDPDVIHGEKWNHLVFTYEGTTCKVYHQGSLFATGTVATAGNTATGFMIGGSYGYATTGGYDPAWDILRVYHSVLTEAEILNNYNVEKSRFSPLAPAS